MRPASFGALRSHKVGSISPMVNSSEFRIGQYRDDDHREDAPQFRNYYKINPLKKSSATLSHEYRQ